MTDANRRFAGLAGIEYKKSLCGLINGCCIYRGRDNQCKDKNYCENQKYPDFSIAISVLMVMREREDFELFMAKLMYGFEQEGVEAIDWDHNIDIDYILTPGALRDEAIKFLEEKRW